MQARECTCLHVLGSNTFLVTKHLIDVIFQSTLTVLTAARNLGGLKRLHGLSLPFSKSHKTQIPYLEYDRTQ